MTEEGTTVMGRRAYEKLARICASLNTSEQELAHSLGISRVALKAIDRERDEHPTFSFVNDAAR